MCSLTIECAEEEEEEGEEEEKESVLFIQNLEGLRKVLFKANAVRRRRKVYDSYLEG